MPRTPEARFQHRMLRPGPMGDGLTVPFAPFAHGRSHVPVKLRPGVETGWSHPRAFPGLPRLPRLSRLPTQGFQGSWPIGAPALEPHHGESGHPSCGSMARCSRGIDAGILEQCRMPLSTPHDSARTHTHTHAHTRTHTHTQCPSRYPFPLHPPGLALWLGFTRPCRVR